MVVKKLLQSEKNEAHWRARRHWVVVLAFCLGGSTTIGLKQVIGPLQARMRPRWSHPGLDDLHRSGGGSIHRRSLDRYRVSSIPSACLCSSPFSAGDGGMPEGFATLLPICTAKARAAVPGGCSLPSLRFPSYLSPCLAIGCFVSPLWSKWRRLAIGAGLPTVAAVEGMVPEAHEQREVSPWATCRAHRRLRFVLLDLRIFRE